MRAPASAATGKRPAQVALSAEKSRSWSVLPAVTPITDTPRAAKSSIACENSAASMLQPGVFAAGKKYSTTGPRCSASESEYSNASPASQAGAVKSGASSPGCRVARAWKEQAEARARVARTRLRLIGCMAGSWCAPSLAAAVLRRRPGNVRHCNAGPPPWTAAARVLSASDLEAALVASAIGGEQGPPARFAAVPSPHAALEEQAVGHAQRAAARLAGRVDLLQRGVDQVD